MINHCKRWWNRIKNCKISWLINKSNWMKKISKTNCFCNKLTGWLILIRNWRQLSPNLKINNFIKIAISHKFKKCKMLSIRIHLRCQSMNLTQSSCRSRKSRRRRNAWKSCSMRCRARDLQQIKSILWRHQHQGGRNKTRDNKIRYNKTKWKMKQLEIAKMTVLFAQNPYYLIVLSNLMK